MPKIYIAVLAALLSIPAPALAADDIPVKETVKEGARGAAWSAIPHAILKGGSVLKVGTQGFAIGAGDYAVDKSKRLKKRPIMKTTAKGAIRGMQVGTFVGLPAVGAGIGAGVGALFGAGKRILHPSR